ncbi:hypothetical protein [Pannonibacter sp. SL95]|uniref:hypothetical protein n=1 Tax=Pannonibacter sp. SL95 TaxID=2995153 RepID=UPI002273A641|nr:hypothetical protein [Pannonibacter sp. SL95]MCY1705507.1 hypothetical protein [Pannonibacter sp. SL95]
MTRLDDHQQMNAEAEHLRQRRRDLLAEANRRRWRLHRLPDLQQQLARATTDLMRMELEARRETESKPDGHDSVCEKPRYWWIDE